MTIIADLKGFTLAHKVYVIDNDNIKMITQSSIKNMPELICDLAYSYGAEKVILSGSSKYKEDIKSKIKNTFIAKFACECNFEVE